jgi:hypothetical protein
LLEQYLRLAVAYRLSGDVLSNSGDSQGAAVHDRKALEVEPGAQHALRVCGAAMASGEQQKAQEFLQD